MKPKAPMTPYETMALKASIEHWRKNKDGEFDGIGEDNCALCNIFLHSPPYTCDGCPVMNKTGQHMCLGTPYHWASEALQEFGSNSKQFRAAAGEEWLFLKSLLPFP
jgi:hypothetical protein